MNIIAVTLFFVLMTGIGLLAGHARHWPSGRLSVFINGMSIFITLFPVEYLIFLPWLGNRFGAGALLMEIMLLAGIPAFFFWQRQNSIGLKASSSCPTRLSGILLLTYLFIRLILSLTVSIFFIESVFDGSITYLIILIVLAAIYTVFGKMQSVRITQGIQALFFMAALLVVVITTQYYIRPVVNFSTDVAGPVFPDASFSLWQVAVVAILVGVWNWCLEQQVGDHLKEQPVSRGQVVGAGLLKFIFAAAFLITVMVVPSQEMNQNSQLGIGPVFNNFFIPKSLRWLVQLGILAVIMSSLAASFQAISGLIAEKIYKELKAPVRDSEVQLVGKLTVMVTAIIAIILLVLLKSFSPELIFTGFELWLGVVVIFTVPFLIRRFSDMDDRIFNISILLGTGICILRFIALLPGEGRILQLAWMAHFDLFQYLVLLAGLMGIIAAGGNLIARFIRTNITHEVNGTKNI